MKWMLVLSLVVALAAFLCPIFFFWTSSPKLLSAFHVCLILATCWALLFIAGVLKFRKRGLWLLLGLPFALAWPAWYVLLVAACFGGDCL